MSLQVSSGVTSASIPSFLKAPSAEKLREFMLINNKKLKGYVTYFDIQYVPKDKKWYCWYIVDIEKLLLAGGKL